jgi:hypothetical protein
MGDKHKRPLPFLCDNCGRVITNEFDRKYLKTFHRCWECEKGGAEKGKITQEELLRREQMALKARI